MSDIKKKIENISKSLEEFKENREKKESEFIDKRKQALYNYTKCMNPHLEKIVDRMQKNKAYVTSDFSQFCVQERNGLNNYNTHEYAEMRKKGLENFLNKIE